ncbi:hypothetical protein P3G55_19495 [Leptospira sp. 96542]|nr:hypothetical protein [Leptospira sp. 96542]
MKQILIKIGKEASGFLRNTSKSKQFRLILIFYGFIAIPFFVYHEFHLPWHYILLLTIVSTMAGLTLTYVSLYIIIQYWKHPFFPVWELLTLFILIFALWLSEVFYFRAGVVFIFLFLITGFLIRILKIESYAKLLVASCLILANALISFRALQGAEILSAYMLFKNKYQFEEKNLNEWQNNGNKFWNSELEFGFELAEDFYFFNPSDLSFEEKTGAGQIAGLIASSDTDAERYPFIRIFYFPDYLGFTKEQAFGEFSSFLNIQTNKGILEDLQEIQQKEVIPNVVGSHFWTFYDPFRPRYAKTGFIVIETPKHDKILLHITENLEKDEIHEEGIRKILSSIRFAYSSESNE